jgi:hypothetical protein
VINFKPLFWTLFLAVATGGVAIFLWYLLLGH